MLQNNSTNTSTLLTTIQAASFLNVSPRTLEGLRHRGGGPNFRKLSKCVRYEVADLEKWVEQSRRTSTSDQGETAS
jgi:hypothetical protein